MLLCLCSSVAHAGDIQVNLALESTDAPGGEFVSGMLALEVINLSSESIGNVHLRPESLEGLGLASDVLQFGSLGPGDAARSMERFHGLASSTEASAMSTWSLDYDEAGGQHRQLTLTLEHE
jgi:hypothetical protein